MSANHQHSYQPHGSPLSSEKPATQVFVCVVCGITQIMRVCAAGRPCRECAAVGCDCGCHGRNTKLETFKV